jgi:two-component system, sensor histidine kinase ChiS
MHWFKRYTILTYSFIILLQVSGSLSALEPDKSLTQYRLNLWNMRTGLPGNTVFSLTQTNDGYLWLGTQDGLVRFDGIRFQLFEKNKVPQLQSNVIRVLFADSNNNLWIGTSPTGLTMMKDGRFKDYPSTICKGLESICAINEDRNGNLWFGSLTQGLTCLKDGIFTTYTTTNGLPHNQVRFISKDSADGLWVTTAEGIIRVIRPGKFEIHAANNVLPHLKTAAVFKKQPGDLLIGTGSNGLFQLHNGKFTHFNIASGLPHLTVTCIFEDSNGNPWIGTDGGGLVLMKNGDFQSLPLENPRTCGYINSIFEDREGSLWVGTLDSGVCQLCDSKFTTFANSEGIEYNFINGIFHSHDNHLWIASHNKVYKLKGKKAALELTVGKEPKNNIILSMIEDSKGFLWIGTLSGVLRYKDGKTTTYRTNQGLSDNRIRCMMADGKGNVWIGTENGLNRFNIKDQSVTVFTTSMGLHSNLIEHVFKDHNETVWVFTGSGTNLVKQGKVSNIPPLEGLSNRLGKNLENFIVRSSYEDKNGTIWLGSTNGLLRLEGRSIFHYDNRCGLIDNHVYSILEDDAGHLWLAGRNGISRISKGELIAVARKDISHLHPDTYNELDGMKSRRCTGRGCRGPDGKLWFPTSVGVTMIDPYQIKNNRPPPSLIIETLVVDGESVNMLPYMQNNIQVEENSSQETRGSNKRLEIMPGKIRLDFHYTAASFINPEKIKFKIKLEGYDKDWVDMGTRRNTTYTGLPPGKYTFKATGCNADGKWSQEFTSLTFYLKPYFFQTTWFYIVTALMLLSAGLFFPILRIRQLKTRSQKLNRLVELRTRDLNERTTEAENAHRELLRSQKIIESKNAQLEAHSKKLQDIDEMKSHFFANISHEFRTPLTLITGPLEQIIAETNDNSLKAKMSMMLRNSRRLLTLVNQLLELAKFDSGIMKLKASRQNIVSLVQKITMCFESLAHHNKIELIYERAESNIPVYFDADKLEKIITNLLSNAFNYTPKGGAITVTVKKESGVEGFPEDCAKISVRDTGAGIPPDQLPHIFERFYRGKNNHGYHRKGTGIGLALTKELIELHKGDIRVYSRNEQDNNRGTEFIIWLPTGKRHLNPSEIVEPLSSPQALCTKDLLESHDCSTLEQDSRKLEETNESGITEDGSVESTDESSEKAINSNHSPKPVILLVEDNADVRSYVREPLSTDYRVETAADGRRGLELARTLIPDLIISDVMMPEMDGYELSRELKNDIGTSHIPIILLTAKASEDSMITGLETGADDYITKPFSVAVLKVRIKNLIELRRQLQLNVNREMTLQPSKMAISKIDREFLEDLQAVIKENIGDSSFSVEKLSKKLYMSNSTLYRKIQALSGETPTEFIRSFRLKKGAELLRNDFGTVLEVALEVGFSSANYFTKCFKKKFNLLPTEYRSDGKIEDKK